VVVLPTPPFWFAIEMTRAIKVRSESTRRIPVMFGLPLLAGVVGLAFGAVVLKQYSERRRPYQAAWGAALLCFGAAALWEAAGIFGGWTPVLYKGYYLLGGILNVGWLGVGSLYVLAPRRWGHIGALVMAVITVLAVPAVVLSPTDAHLLTASVPGRGAIGAPATFFPPVTNSIGSLILIGGAAWAAYRSYRSHAGGSRVVGLALIAAGALVVAGTHTLAQVRNAYYVQPVGEAIGILVMFMGYLGVEARALPMRRRSAA